MTTAQVAARSAQTSAAASLAYVSVFAALIAACALTPAIPIGPVPITLQTLGVALAGLCLGPWRGALACALYVAVGLAGLPVFSGGAAGIGVLAGPTGGYLVAFPLAAIGTGLVARWAVGRGLSPLTGALFFAGVALARLVVIWPLGAAGMARALGKSWTDALVIDMTFWVGDSIKAVVATLLALAVHRAFPRLLRR